MYITTYASPVGEMTLAAEGDYLCGLWLAGQKYFGGAVLAGATKEVRDDLPVFDAARGWLVKYFAGKQPPITDLVLQPGGSDFRQGVWKILCDIPYGETLTYGAIARQLGCKSAQAVGGAVGHNPISLIIPCHRVVGADGGLTGYAGGVDVKRRLLALERGEVDWHKLG